LRESAQVPVQIDNAERKPQGASARLRFDPSGPWNAMLAPHGTPSEVLAKLADALGQALDDSGVQSRYIEPGSSAPRGAERGPVGLQTLVESEVARITPIIEAAGVTN